MASHGSVGNGNALIFMLIGTMCITANGRTYETRRSGDGIAGASAINDLPMHGPSADNQGLPNNLGAPYPGKNFGPMGPVDHAFPGDAVGNLANGVGNDKSSPITTDKPPRQYEVFKVEFPRVETPFLIGIWIFFASLAKIGESSSMVYVTFSTKTIGPIFWSTAKSYNTIGPLYLSN